MENMQITLVPADASELPRFKQELQDSFAVAVVEASGPLKNGPIPADADLDGVFAGPGAVVLHILADSERVGGAVLSIDVGTHRNALELLFMSTSTIGRGIGRRAWAAIEARYPETKVWQTHTPYFEKRNIHFYVNVCGFSIVEFFNAHHADTHRPGPNDLPGGGEMFRFEKVMG